jgi:hypothetical protein
MTIHYFIILAFFILSNQAIAKEKCKISEAQIIGSWEFVRGNGFF